MLQCCWRLYCHPKKTRELNKRKIILDDSSHVVDDDDDDALIDFSTSRFP